MVEAIYDETGKCVAWCEWTLADKMGNITNHGKYVYIYEIWCFKNIKSLPQIIRNIYEKTPTAKWVYWKRTKYNERMKLFPKWRFKKWVEKKKKPQ